MTLKIERFRTRIRLSGELRSAHLDQIEAELLQCGSSVVLDLEEVNLTDVEGVRFLNACETKGISVVHCSPYIKAWMLQERGQRQEHPERWLTDLMSDKQGQLTKVDARKRNERKKGEQQ